MPSLNEAFVTVDNG